MAIVLVQQVPEYLFGESSESGIASMMIPITFA